MITPFRDAQQQAREIIESEGRFVQIYVKCPVEVCEERDPKGLYKQARAGKIEKFTGINHPFQEPLNPEIVVDTSTSDVEECTKHVVSRLEEDGVLTESLNDEYDFDVTGREEQEIKERLVEMGHLQDDER